MKRKAATSGNPAASNGGSVGSSGHPAARKVYVAGSRPDLRVPMREISLTEPNPPVRLYDTSGPYTDPAVTIDLERGLERRRVPWILERGDVEELAGPTSRYRREREADPKLDAVRFPGHTVVQERGADRPYTQGGVSADEQDRTARVGHAHDATALLFGLVVTTRPGRRHDHLQRFEYRLSGAAV